MRNTRRRFVVAIATIGSLSLITAACGSDGGVVTIESEPPSASAPESESTPVETGFPVTIDVYGTPFTVDTRPERIISLSPSSTEGLFAVGAGSQVIAADEFSDYPAEAPTSELSGFTPNVEAIVALDPDLVVVSYDPGDLVASLAATGVQVLILDAASDLSDVMRQLIILGEVTGNADTAIGVVAALEDRIAAAVAGAPALDEPLTYFHLLDETLFTITSSTFAGSVYELFGLVNVADAADPDGSAFGYPQLSTEFLVDADPDLVFLSSGDVASFAALPVLGQLRAVEDDAVIALAPDISSRWGPRIVDFLEQIATAIADLAAVASPVLTR
jgi:iron complex transport system substrate-binding protein